MYTNTLTNTHQQITQQRQQQIQNYANKQCGNNARQASHEQTYIKNIYKHARNNNQKQPTQQTKENTTQTKTTK